MLTLNDFKTHMLLDGWDVRLLTRVEDETHDSYVWHKNERTVWWSKDNDGRWSFLYAPKGESVMSSYYTFEKILEVLDDRTWTPDDTFRRLHAG